MEKKFNHLLKISKALEGPYKTFEFDLFKDSNWFLSMNDLDLNADVFHPMDIIPADISIEPIKVNQSENESNFLIDLLFIGDTFKKESEGEDLLAKMIQAMKIAPDRFERLPFDESLEELLEHPPLENNYPAELESLITTIASKRPRYVISLGAIATNLLLNRREKMSAIHGKFFKLVAHDFEYQLVPIFHPDFLIINPNMKRTAWIDLQQVMQALGKI